MGGLPFEGQPVQSRAPPRNRLGRSNMSLGTTTSMVSVLSNKQQRQRFHFDIEFAGRCEHLISQILSCQAAPTPKKEALSVMVEYARIEHRGNVAGDVCATTSPTPNLEFFNLISGNDPTNNTANRDSPTRSWYRHPSYRADFVLTNPVNLTRKAKRLPSMLSR